MDQIAWLAVPKLADLSLVLLVDRDLGVLRPAAIASRHSGGLRRARTTPTRRSWPTWASPRPCSCPWSAVQSGSG